MSDGPPRRRAKSPSPDSEAALPSASSLGIDDRVVAAWREWLGALATDAEAALAAAMAYKALDATARDLWLSALEQDAASLDVPRIAVYAPLLAVESDPERRARIALAIGPDDDAASPRAETRALRGLGADGLCVATIVWPLYLEFVQVLACGYRQSEGFAWVRHDPIVQGQTAPQSGDEVMGVVLEGTALRALVDELALTVLAHHRSGRELPEALKMFADMFAPEYSIGPASGSST